jgi:hypothetical protein
MYKKAKGFVTFLLFLFALNNLKGEEENLKLRRSLLSWHQTAGLTTWTLWLATNLVGEKAYKTMYRKSDEFARYILITNPQYSNDPFYFLAIQPPDKKSIAANYLLLKDPEKNLPLYLTLKQGEEYEARKYGSTHAILARATFISYVLTASFAFSAPPVIQFQDRGGIDSIFFHKSMIPIHLASMVYLAKLSNDVEHKKGAAREMKNTGWVGFTALSIALITITF